MKITYRNGQVSEAVLLARDGDHLRVAVDGADDAVSFTRINGVWISDDCEPVRLEFAWESGAARQEAREEDCLCPPELAARLIQLLYTDSTEDEPVPSVPMDSATSLAATVNQ